MNYILSGVNLVGVLALAIMCATQWRANRELNLQNISLDQTRLRDEVKIAEQDTAIKGYAADMEEFRGRLQRSQTSLKEESDRAARLTLENEDLMTARDQLVRERDQLKESLKSWVAAVAARDEAIKADEAATAKMAGARNEAVEKFNELAAKYNDLVKVMNAERAERSAGAATTRVVEKMP